MCWAFHDNGAAVVMLHAAHALQDGKAKKGHVGPFDKKWLMIFMQDLAVTCFRARGLLC